MPPHVDDETTLVHHLITGIDSLIEGKVPAAAMRLYSAQDHTTPSYTRDASCWANDIVAKLTAISPWNSHGSYTQAGVLISPRHVLFATHFFPPAGTTIRFVTAANVVVDRTLSATESLTVTGTLYPDLTVGLLDSDVPGTISFMKVLPSGFDSKLPGSLASFKIPVAATDQEEKLQIHNLTSLPSSSSPLAYLSLEAPTSGARSDYYENFITGDSGSPCFCILNGEAVLLTVVSVGNAGAGTSIAAFRDDINAAMTTLGGGYQLTTVDLSSFPDV